MQGRMRSVSTSGWKRFQRAPNTQVREQRVSHDPRDPVIVTYDTMASGVVLQAIIKPSR
jgi:hypothetical protein